MSGQWRIIDNEILAWETTQGNQITEWLKDVPDTAYDALVAAVRDAARLPAVIQARDDFRKAAENIGRRVAEAQAENKRLREFVRAYDAWSENWDDDHADAVDAARAALASLWERHTTALAVIRRKDDGWLPLSAERIWRHRSKREWKNGIGRLIEEPMTNIEAAVLDEATRETP